MNNPSPKISIAIPLYNCESHLRATIESVLAQTYEDFELIILDDQSNDRSAEIVRSYKDPRIRYELNAERLGFFGNWNRCLKVMNAPYCKLLPHDDILESTCLEKQAQVLDKYPEVKLVHCARKIIDPAGNTLATRRLREPEGIKDTASSLRQIVRSGTNPIGEPAAVMFRKTTKEQIAGFSDADMYSIDVEYWSRLLAEGKRYYIDEVLCSFRVWPDSASVQLFGSQSRSMRAFFDRLKKQFPEIIRPTDVRIGALKSLLMEIARGGFYLTMRLKNG
ncbi:MAG: glycosyltransferase family 2 protein [Thermodesulfobacteriota bacterium]